MTALVQPRAAATTWVGRQHLDGGAAAAGARMREAAHRLLLGPALRAFAGQLRVEGAPPRGPVVLLANHASHADTVAVRTALGPQLRRRLAVAAAEDYFFATRGRGIAATIAVGAFPFPRSGATGLRRAEELLQAGWSVLLYPQGTRDPHARIRPGALRLAEDGWTLVPVGIAGTADVLPKGASSPRRHRVAVVFGAPLEPAATGDAGLDILTRAIGSTARRAEELTRR